MAAARAILTLALTLAAGVATGAALIAASDAPASAPAIIAQVPLRAACLHCHEPHYADSGICVDCHRGDDRARRANLAHHRLLGGAAATWMLPDSPVLPRAEALRDSLGCRRCHVTGGKGEKLAIDLDTVAWPRTQDELRHALTRPAAAMPAFGLGTTSADTLIAALLRDADRFSSSGRYQVRFRVGSGDSLGVFARLCGGCHQALTPDGPQGSGTAGANLSGLFGAHYPSGPDASWDRARLERWLRNPRSLRAGASMPPVAVEPVALDVLLEMLTPLTPQENEVPARR